MVTLREVIEDTPELRGLTYPEVAAWLNAAPLVDNPAPRADVPAPVTLEQVMAIVPDAEAAKCYRLPGLIEDLRRAMDSNNHAWLGKLLGIALADGAITPGTAGKLQPLLTTMVPDPAYSETIPGPARWQSAGLPGPVSAADVQGALHATTD